MSEFSRGVPGKIINLAPSGRGSKNYNHSAHYVVVIFP